MFIFVYLYQILVKNKMLDQMSKMSNPTEVGTLRSGSQAALLFFALIM